MTVLEIIKAVTDRKKEQKIYPNDALTIEISNYIKEKGLKHSWDAVKKELNRLVKEKAIIYRDTINYLSFKINENGRKN